LVVRHRTTGVAEALTTHLPATAHRVRNGVLEDVPCAALERDDLVIVRIGEIVPADGVIVEGETSLDESLLSGESTPVRRAANDAVCAGTRNTQAPIVMRVTAIGAATVLSNIVAMLRQAQAQKPTIAQAADRAAAKFLRYVLFASGVVCAVWLAIDPSRAFEATLAVLVVACPCAFSLAMPAALAAATGALARQGVLIAHPDAIESLARIDHVVFDKTGTLTRGEVRLQSCTPFGNLPAAECLRIACAREGMSEHPIAKAFALAASPTGAQPTVQQVRVAAGAGIEGIVDGRRYRLGRADFVAELRGERGAGSLDTDSGSATVTLGDESQALAQFVFSDTCREDSREAVRQLHALGVRTEILSGDARPAVEQIAERCGIERFCARQSPAQKLERMRSLQSQGAHAAMIGDGINDAPVMAAANVSVAMGRGAALALAAADIVLVSERLTALPEAIRAARRTMRIARQNLIWSAAYNFCALPLAALGLIPPWAAAVGMSLSSIAVVMNGVRAGAGRWARSAGQK